MLKILDIATALLRFPVSSRMRAASSKLIKRKFEKKQLEFLQASIKAKEAYAQAKEAAAEESKSGAKAKEADAQAKEAGAEEKEAGVEAKKFRMRVLNWLAALSVFGLCIAAEDLLWHEYDPYIRWRMKNHMKQQQTFPGKTHQWLVDVPELSLIDNRPHILLGPTGSGKTTALQAWAQKLSAQGRPVVFIGLRNVGQESPNHKEQTFSEVAERLLESISYPTRHSWVFNIMMQDTPVDPIIHVHRVRHAFNLLFKVCEELTFERINQGIPAADASPLVFFDDIQDLVRTDRKFVGGQALLNHLGNQIVSYSIDKETASFVIAGSSATLLDDIKRYAPVLDDPSRRVILTMPAPNRPHIFARLTDLGYSESQQSMLMFALGDRFRTLTPFLAAKLSNFQFYQTLEQSIGQQILQICPVFSQISDEAGKRQIADILDKLSFTEKKYVPSSSVPTALSRPEAIEKLLYKDWRQGYVLQNQAVAVAWAFSRDRYSGASSVPQSSIRQFQEKLNYHLPEPLRTAVAEYRDLCIIIQNKTDISQG